MTTARGRLALVGLGAGAAATALFGAGEGSLAAPPSARWRVLEAWYAEVGPAAATLTCLRLAALAAAGWLLLAAVLQLLATSSSRVTLHLLADAVSPRSLQRVARGAASLSIMVGLVGPPAPTDPAGTAVMEALDGEATTSTTTTAPPTTTEPPTTTTTRAPADPAPGPTPAAPVGIEEVVVASGDSFWSLAADAVADGSVRGPVDRYWRHLVALNGSRLVDPGNPDLLYPGQVLVLPPREG